MKTWAVFVLLCNIVDVTEVSGNSTLVVPCLQLWTLLNGKCFYFVRREMTWNQAEDYCQSMGGNLASIENIFEYRQIQGLIMNGTNDLPVTWAGGTNKEEVSVWCWVDGREVTFSDWCPGEPNSITSKQQCLQINYSSEKCWDDDHCDATKASLCATPAGFGPFSSGLNSRVNPLQLLPVCLAFFLLNMF